MLAGAGYAAYRPAVAWWKERNKVTFRTEKVSRGEIEAYVNSTGEVKPVRSVNVGAFVSGPIIQLLCDFNDRVVQGQLLAEIDPRLPTAAVERERATLATREADVERVEAQLQQAKNDEERAKELRAENKDFLSQAEFDRLFYARISLDAQLKVAEAQVLQATANLENAEANLEYTQIVAPVDGIVIDRKIDEGQTVASGFQTPELFVIAPRMDEVMHVFASVDEADIGLIRDAQQAGREVKFNVDAYPNDDFIGTIEQIRFSSTTTQNVVTYPVVVAAPNPDLKLLPGMTADLSFLIERKTDVLRVPNAALRYFPAEALVRPEDRKVLSGESSTSTADDAKDEPDSVNTSGDGDGDSEEANAEDTEVGDAGADESTIAGSTSAEPEVSNSEDEDDDEVTPRRESRVRHVWVKDGELLRAIEVRTGLSDSQYTEVIEGEIEDDEELVVGVK